jgi:uncharacterized protein
MVRLPLNIVARNSLHIAVFCKPLIAGQVKTRLIPAYGAEVATRIYSQLAALALNNVRSACAALDASSSLWVAGDVMHPSIRDWARRFAVSTHTQCAGDLGAKMSHCLSTIAQNHDRVLLIGTDCPALDVAHLGAAAEALNDNCNWVFTPAEDGGYVLVGSNASTPIPFHEISWSTPRVMAQTRDALRAKALTWTELPVMWDVDEPIDVERARSAGLLDTF